MLISLHAVSIHAPREGCDSEDTFIHIGILRFNSRTPGGVRRNISFVPLHLTQVSIHAPREGCDGEWLYS